MSIKIDRAAHAAYHEHLEEQTAEHREVTLRGDFATSLQHYYEQVTAETAIQPLSTFEQKLVNETVRLIESDERHLRQFFPGANVGRLAEHANQMNDDELLAHARHLCINRDQPSANRRREVLNGFDPSAECILSARPMVTAS